MKRTNGVVEELPNFLFFAHVTLFISVFGKATVKVWYISLVVRSGVCFGLDSVSLESVP